MNSKNHSGQQRDPNKFLFSAIADPKLLGFLALLSIVIYLPVLKADFLWYDDDMMLFNNPLVHQISLTSILKLFSFENIVHYHPLVYLSYAVEYGLFGLDPFNYHLDNLLLHIANVILVYYFVTGLSRNKNIAFITALFFTVHPLHVESVAWVTERKDLLFSLFYLSSIIFYIKYIKQNSKRFYVYSILLFVLACLSKAMAVTLPFVILLVEFTLFNNGKESIRKKLAVVMPYFIVAVLTSIINLKVAYYETGIGIYSLYERAALVCYAILLYPVKMLFPFDLSAIYGFPASPGPLILASPLILAAVIVLLMLRKNIHPRVKFGLLFYIITVIPALPILPFGISFAADRFSYIPLIGLFYIAACYLVKVYNKFNSSAVYRNFITAGMISVAFLFSYLTYNRAQLWKNTEVLMNDVIKKDAGNPHAYYILGNYYSACGSIEKAISGYVKSIEMKGNYSEAYYNLGNIYFRSGSLNEAASCFLKAVELNPGDRLAHNNLGVTYENMGEYDKAFRHYKVSAELGYEPAQHVLKYYGVLK